jgi:hypothetical protein
VDLILDIFRGIGYKSLRDQRLKARRPHARTSGGKAVDCAQVETDLSEAAARVERSAHQKILGSLDIDVAAVIIGGVRYTKVGRCPAPYHSMAGSVSVERALYRRSGARGGTPEGKVVDPASRSTA